MRKNEKNVDRSHLHVDFVAGAQIENFSYISFSRKSIIFDFFVSLFFYRYQFFLFFFIFFRAKAEQKKWAEGGDDCITSHNTKPAINPLFSMEFRFFLYIHKV